MNKKVILYSIVAILIIIIGVGIGYLVLFQNKEELNKETEEIIKYELKTHESFEINHTKYYINNEEEIESFYKLYSNALDLNKEYLKDNTIFIELIQAGSGSISMKLKDVKFDNNEVNFIIDAKYPEIGTDDIVTWYLVAIIPNNKLNNIKLDNWKKPSVIIEELNKELSDKYVFNLDSNNKYEVTTDLKFSTMLNDGGSHINLYYEIDLDNNVVSKITEKYKANLMGTPETTKNINYIKKINNNLTNNLNASLNEFINKEDINDSTNYHYFTIKRKDSEKIIYNTTTIKEINKLLEQIDNS